MKIRRHTCPPPRGDPVKWPKWAKMGKTGSFEKIFIGREVKIGPWPSLVSCRPKQELNNSGGTLRLKFRTLAANFNFQAPVFMHMLYCISYYIYVKISLCRMSTPTLSGPPSQHRRPEAPLDSYQELVRPSHSNNNKGHHVKTVIRAPTTMSMPAGPQGPRTSQIHPATTPTGRLTG